MAQDKKQKKLAKKQRLEQLKRDAQAVQEKLRDHAQTDVPAVAYVLEADRSDEEKEEQAPRPPAADPTAASTEDEDRVALPAAPTAAPNSGARSSGSTYQRKHHKISWQDLKLAVAQRYGPEAAALVTEHDGNAEDPAMTVLMKMQPHSVPVPRHWDRLRSYMSHQADREEAVHLVPPEIAALGVDKLRASKDKKANPNQVAFVTCFLTGTPLQRKDFGVPLSRFGDAYFENKWRPKAHFQPGVLSQRLRQALGISSSAPPPWLYSMQAMRRLPPAYPGLRLPGLNAPIPPGAQWGQGQGQWGEPPRGANKTFLFPGVMDEAAEERRARPLWGEVPALTAEGIAAATAPPPAPTVAVPTAAGKAPVPPPSKQAPKGPAINPTPFAPQAYQGQQQGGRAAPAGPREYVRVQDGGSGTVAGHKMVPKGAPGS